MPAPEMNELVASADILNILCIAGRSFVMTFNPLSNLDTLNFSKKAVAFATNSAIFSSNLLNTSVSNDTLEKSVCGRVS